MLSENWFEQKWQFWDLKTTMIAYNHQMISIWLSFVLFSNILCLEVSNLSFLLKSNFWQHFLNKNFSFWTTFTKENFLKSEKTFFWPKKFYDFGRHDHILLTASKSFWIWLAAVIAVKNYPLNQKSLLSGVTSIFMDVLTAF